MNDLAEEARRAEDEGNLDVARGKWKLLAESQNSKIYYLQYGRIAQHLRLWQEAEDAYSNAMEIGVSSLQLELMGSLWALRTDKEERSSFETAIEFFRKAISLKGNARLFTQQGAAHAELEQFALAAEAFEQALLLDQNYEEAMYNLAKLHESNNPVKARRLLERAVEIDNEYGLAHQMLGKVYQRKGDLNKAAHHFRRCLEIDTKDYWSRLYLANLLALQGLKKEAEQHYEEAILMRPELDAGRTIYANFLDSIGEYERAMWQRNKDVGRPQ